MQEKNQSSYEKYGIAFPDVFDSLDLDDDEFGDDAGTYGMGPTDTLS